MDTSARRLRSYDEYSSQGSTGAASHDEESVIGTTAHRNNTGGGGGGGNLMKNRHYGVHLRSDSSPLTSSRLGPLINNNSNSNAKEGSVGRGGGDYYLENSVNSNRRRCDRSPGKREKGLSLLHFSTFLSSLSFSYTSNFLCVF